MKNLYQSQKRKKHSTVEKQVYLASHLLPVGKWDTSLKNRMSGHPDTHTKKYAFIC
jgi:hypothetical protein